MKPSLDLAVQQKRMMYITSLLNEALPSSMLTKSLQEEMDIDEQDAFGLVHILFNNHLQDTIETKDTSSVADWKAEIHRHMLDVFDADFILSGCILNLAPYTRTLVYSHHPEDLPLLKNHIRQWFEASNAYLMVTEKAEMIAFANPKVVPFKEIGQLYKELRQLQNYQYTIGMGHLTFYEDFKFNNKYSVTEHKFIQRYESLLKAEDFDALKTLASELELYIYKHIIKDSKITYIYKELMSITIRHLYSQETEYLKVIEALNFTINNFSSQFNDLTDIGAYIHDLLTTLKTSAKDESQTHPHIKKVLRIIETDYAKDLTLDAIADSLNLSDAYLSRLFKEEMAITYKHYLTKFRLNIIKNLLTKTNKSITSIASLTGYHSANQLTRIFKKYEQMTPRQYRQSK